mmetsp:Transcript_12555/g.41391  ORF Transcript_12555/g.41391 Transcript_12555/m.41391 type:complete len:1129 (+) Transcript_12555:66-3452(+)
MVKEGHEDGGAAAALLTAAASVREQYARDTGLNDALMGAVERLFGEEELPANPFFYMAERLAVNVDRSGWWQLSNEQARRQLVRVEEVDPDRQLCKVAGYGQAWGFEYVLALADTQGLQHIREMLQTLPPSLFPFPKEYRGGDFTVQILASLVNGWPYRPAVFRHFPARLGIRQDVLITGPQMDVAMQQFCMHMRRVALELDNMGEHCVSGIVIDPKGVTRIHMESDRQRWTPQMLRSRLEAFMSAISRAVLNGQRTWLELVAAVRVPSAYSKEKQPTHVTVQVLFTFHYATEVGGNVEHFATMQHESLYSGLFTEQQAMTQYADMWGPDASPQALTASDMNRDFLRLKLAHDYRGGNKVRCLPTLSYLLNLEGEDEEGDEEYEDDEAGFEDESDELFSPTLIAMMRMMNGGSAELSALVDQARSLRSALMQDGLEDAPLKLSHASEHFLVLRESASKALPHIGLGDVALETVSLLAVERLKQFDMGDDNLLQVEELPGCIDALRVFEQLCSAAALTIFRNQCERCPRVARLLSNHLELAENPAENSVVEPVVRLKEPNIAGTSLVLDSDSAVREMKERRTAPPGAIEEAPFLQYAADTNLLSALHLISNEMVTPPLTSNPYPIVVRRLRAHALAFELGARTNAELVRMVKNGIRMHNPALAVYATQGRGTVTSAAKTEPAKEDGAVRTVYGTFSAITLADAKSLVEAARTLKDLLKARTWQSGAYQFDAVTAFGGDACMSNAIALWNKRAFRGDVDDNAGELRFSLVLEEHTLCSGPRKSEALHLYAAGVARRILQLVEDSPFIVRRLRLPGRLYGRSYKLEAVHFKRDRDELFRLIHDAYLEHGELPVYELYTILNKYEGYVPVRVQHHFHFKDSDGIDEDAERPNEYVAPEAIEWPILAYSQVFVNAEDAEAFAKWFYASAGDPGEPFHADRAVEQLWAESSALMGKSEMLPSLKALMRRALVLQSWDTIALLSRALGSSIQQHHFLRPINRMLSAMMLAPGPPASLNDHPRLNKVMLRQEVIEYCEEIMTLLCAPESCPFQGIRELVSASVDAVLGRVARSHTLDAATTALMQRLHAWAKVSEFTLGRSVLDALRMLPGGACLPRVFVGAVQAKQELWVSSLAP